MSTPKMFYLPNNKQQPLMQKKTNWAGCVVVCAFLAVALSITAIVLGVIATRTANSALGQKVYNTGGEVDHNPLTHLLTGASLPMTLPNDLTSYVGKTYQINSDGLFTHTITIQPGTLSTTFDGTNKVATFAGVQKGEGFTMTVVAKDVIRLGSVNGVTFS